MKLSRQRLEHAFRTSANHLLDQRTIACHWLGRLSSSALSTATAVTALRTVLNEIEHLPNKLAAPDHLRTLIMNGISYLQGCQNSDGGWGDTSKSKSNIATTMLVYSSLRQNADLKATDAGQLDSARAYLEKGGWVAGIKARYGKDKTFSVPILTHSAICGQVEWSEIPALPFELAVLPHRFFQTIQLPVVSYALPALIAIGQAVHHHAPSYNPALRLLRDKVRSRTLAKLASIQPESGGFLEATPLTSFVVMSLAKCKQVANQVVERGVYFLIDSVREDGSWPIDTNLATWVTTLSMNALGPELPANSTSLLLSWLLSQQHTKVHPYTMAEPGGWAWTDLSGGVPDADDTPGAILALHEMLSRGDMSLSPKLRQEIIDAIWLAVRWLCRLQNRDGGWPTFCRGWGALPFDRSSNDITAHALRAIKIALVLDAPSEETRRVSHRVILSAVERGFAFLKKNQQPDGSWNPLWFGNEDANDEINPTYGTAKVILAYRDFGRLDEIEPAFVWLRQSQLPSGAWSGFNPIGGQKVGKPSVEETALALEALLAHPKASPNDDQVISIGLDWLCTAVEEGRYRDPTPIGFYFAKLWYFEDLYPVIMTASCLRQALKHYPAPD